MANPNSPSPSSPDTEPIRIVITGLDQNAEHFAQEAAVEEAATKEHRGNFWKRTASRVWHTITRPYQIAKTKHEKLAEIYEENNLRHHQGKEDDAWREATVRRYSSEFGEKLIHEEAGETFHRLADPEDGATDNAAKIRHGTLDLLRRYAKGDITNRDDLEEEFKRMTAEWHKKGVGMDYIGEGRILAHNVFDMAEQVKAAHEAAKGMGAVDEAEEKLEEMLKNAELVAGEARVGSRVEIDPALSERLAKKLKTKKWLNEGKLARVGAVVTNELFVAGAVGVGLNVLKLGAGKLGMSALSAGIVAGFQERRALKQERALAARRLDNDQEVDLENQAQVEMQEMLYESKSAGELIDAIGSLYDPAGNLILTDRDTLEAAMKIRGEIAARLGLDARGSRVVNFSDMTSNNMEDRRFDLELALAKLETDLEKEVSNPTPDPKLNITGENFKDWSNEVKDAETGRIKGEMSEQDVLFRKLVINKSLRRGIITAGTILLGGEIGREAAGRAASGVKHLFEWVTGVNAKAYAASVLPEGLNPSGDPTVPNPETVSPSGGVPNPETVNPSAGGVFNPEIVNPSGNGGVPNPETVNPSGSNTVPNPETIFEGPSVPNPETLFKGSSVIVGENTKLNLPPGFTAENNNGRLIVSGPSGDKFTAQLNKDGSLSAASLEQLRQRGFDIQTHQETVQGEPKITHEKMNAKEYVKNHKDEMVKVTREDWYRNEVGVVDQNERELMNDMNKNGDIVISISGMTAEGSYNDSGSVDYKEAARQGHLKVYLSASPGTQAQAFEFPMSPDGKLVIPNDHPARALFNENGKFIGGYQEVAIAGDKTSSGATRIMPLATVVGRENPVITDTIETPTLETVHVYTVTPSEAMLDEFAARGQESTLGPEGRDDRTPIPFVPLFFRRQFGEARNTAPGPGGPPPGGPNRGPSGMDAQVKTFLDSLHAETRSLPPMFSIDVSGLTRDERAAVIAFCHDVVASVTRNPGEEQKDWARRLEVQANSVAGSMLRVLDSAPNNAIKPILQKALAAVLSSTAAPAAAR